MPFSAWLLHDVDLLKGFFEERMMSTCERFTLKAIEECNKN